MGSNKLKNEVIERLEEYLSDVGFPSDGYEITASMPRNRGFIANVSVFCSGADRFIKEWELVSEDFAEEAQDILGDSRRIEITVRDVSPDADDYDEDGAEVYRKPCNSPDDEDLDDDLDSEEIQYEEEGLSVAYDESELNFNDDYSVDDEAIDDLTLKRILNSLSEDDDYDYVATDDEWEDVYGDRD